MARQIVTLADAQRLPLWRRPESLLFLMAFAMPIAFATWSALLNNFVIEAAQFSGVEIGWLHTVREIPGLLAIGVIFLILFLREQVLGVHVAGFAGRGDGGDGVVSVLWRDAVGDAAVFHRVSLF